MSLDPLLLLPALDRVVAAVDTRAQREPLRTMQVPWFREDEPGSFSLSATTELDWAAIVDNIFEAVTDDAKVQEAVAVIAQALPAPVREATYLPVRGPSPATARVFCAFCEIALRGAASANSTDARPAALDQSIVAAAKDVEAFCAAERHRLVHTAPVAAVALTGDEVPVAAGVRLRDVDDEGRQALWRRVGAIPTTAVVWISPDVDEVAGIEVTCDLAPGNREQPWSELQAPIQPVVDSLRLLGSGSVRWLAQWTAFPEHEPFLRRLFLSGNMRPGPRWSSAPGVDRVVVDDASLLSQLYSWQLGMGSWPDDQRQVYEVAHRRFSQTYERTSDEDRLIDAWVAFEALFLPAQEGELSYRAQMRIARFVGDDLAERCAIRHQLRRSYQTRSNVVHGAPPSRRKPEQVAARTRETIDILRRALRRWINPDTERSGEALDRALLS